MFTDEMALNISLWIIVAGTFLATYISTAGGAGILIGWTIVIIVNALR